MATLTVLERRESYYLGVDVGRRSHTVCAVPRSTFEAGDARWQHAPTLTVPVSRAGFDRIGALLRRLSDDPAGDVVAGLEPTGGYYARTVHAFLRGLGLRVHWVRNNAVHDARDAVYGKKTKTDQADSRLIARLLYLREVIGQEYALTAGHDQVGIYSTMRLLVGNRWKLRQAQARAGNQLTQILDVIFPELAEVFTKSLASNAVLTLLDRYPTPAQVAAAGHDEIYRTVVFEGRAPRKAAQIPQLLSLAAGSVGIAGGIDDLIAAETYLVGQLRRLAEEVTSIEERILATVALAPEAKVIGSFPATSPIRAATILGAMGAPVEAFHSGKALRRHLGWSVEQEQSGTSVHRERLSVSGNRHSRRDMRLWTLALISPRTPWTPFRAHYDRLVAPPDAKRPNVALGHMASKLITVLYTCMSRQEPYDATRLAHDMKLSLPATRQA
jgi:transposase